MLLKSINELLVPGFVQAKPLTVSRITNTHELYVYTIATE